MTGLMMAAGPTAFAVSEINLTWVDHSRIEKEYHVEREIAGRNGFEPLVDDLVADSESYSYEDSTLGGELRFRIYASNEYGASNFSNTVDTLPVEQRTEEDAPFELWVFTDELAELKGPVTAEFLEENTSLIAAVLVVPAEDFRTCRLVFSPVANVSGTTRLKIDLIREGVRLTRTFNLEIIPVNDPPVIESIGSQDTEEDISLEVELEISDLDTLVADLVVSASALDTDLIASAGVELRNGEWILTIIPRENRHGETEVEVAVSDGEFTDNASFSLTVNSVDDTPQFLSDPAPAAVIQGSSIFDLVVQVFDVDTDFADLKLKLATSDPGVLFGYTLIPNAELGEIGIMMNFDPNWSGETVLRILLSDETELEQFMEVPLIVEPAPRVFFGTLGESGAFALHVSGDRSAAFLGWDPETGEAVFREGVVVGLDGLFLDEALDPDDPDLSGTITGFAVTGRIGQSGPLFSGEMIAVEGSVSDFIGLHEGFIEKLAGGVFRAIVGPDGRAFVVLESDSISSGMMIEFDDDGFLQGNLSGLIEFDLQLDPMTRRITGQAEYAGLYWPVAADQDTDAIDSQMANLSTRAWAGSMSESIIAGFVVEGEESMELLIRGVGPGLAGFGVSGVLEDPQLILKQGQGLIASNLDWGLDSDKGRLVEVAQRLGGFPLASGSLDSAIIAILENNVFTAIVKGDAGMEGIALVELYNAALENDSRLVNLSTRLVVREGREAILGFVISGTTRVRLLIRAVGPALAGFDVEGILPDPVLRIYGDSSTSPFLENDDWSDLDAELVRVTSARVGAFPLAPGSSDAAVVVWLDPGVYSAKTVDADGVSGMVLTELYVVP